VLYAAPVVSYSAVRDPQRAEFGTESFVAARAIESDSNSATRCLKQGLYYTPTTKHVKI